MCSNMGAGAPRTAGSAAPTATAAAPVQQAAPQRASGLVSDTGVQDMDDATLTSLVMRAMSATITRDGRDDTIGQRIADALGISQNRPELVSQEALAQYRSQSGANGLMYRTVNDIPGKTARDIAHEMTTSTGDIGLNYAGGRAIGIGLYFAAQTPTSSPGRAAEHSAVWYGIGAGNSYTIEARLKPTARIATRNTIEGPQGRQWALAHQGTLRGMGLRVASNGTVHETSSWQGSTADMRTTLAMLMGYDGYNSENSNGYHTIFNLGALRVAKGNKYTRAWNGSLS